VKIGGMENGGEKVEKTKFSLVWLGGEIWGENGSWIFSTQVHQISSLQIREKTREKTKKELWMMISSLIVTTPIYFLLSFFFN